MVPKQLAFVLLAVACVAAAGGGAYLATLHNAESERCAGDVQRAGGKPDSPTRSVRSVAGHNS